MTHVELLTMGFVVGAQFVFIVLTYVNTRPRRTKK